MSPALALLCRTLPGLEPYTGPLVRRYRALVGGRWYNLLADDTADALAAAQAYGEVSLLLEAE